MRKSVKAKTTKARQAAEQKIAKRQRAALWLGLLAIASLLLLFLSYLNWTTHTSEQALLRQVATDTEQIAKYREQAKINAAIKTEAEAKAKMEAEMAAKAEDERKIAAGKQTNPTDSSTCGVQNPGSITVVINKKHCFSPLEWAPSDLSSVGGYPLRSEAATQLTKMMQNAEAAGAGFSLSSAYRSYQNQIATYNHWVQVNGNAAAADTVSALAGYSEHQTGLAADLKAGNCVLECFGGTASYTWLRANAANYGFIERYPNGLSDITGYAPESWHWRYVGTATAQDMKTKGIQTLEHYFGVAGGSY